MRAILTSSLLTSLLLTTAGCPKVAADGDDNGDDDSDGTDTGASSEESDASSDESSSTAEETGTTSDELPQDCQAACADLVACGQESDLDDCVSICETDIAAHAEVLGNDCAAARQQEFICMMEVECGGAPEACDELGVAVFFACTQTVVPALDALCECLTADVADEPSDPLTAKESCVYQAGKEAVVTIANDGPACFDAYVGLWGCTAASCNDPSCEGDQPPDSCVCDQAADDLLLGCPSLTDTGF